MARRFAVLAVVLLITALFCRFSLAAEDYEAKLKDVRYKKAAVQMNYEKRLAEVTKQGNADLEAIKSDFHAKREERICRLKDEQQKLKDSYENTMTPLKEEERKLLEALSPSGSNFVKTKKRGDDD